MARPQFSVVTALVLTLTLAAGYFLARMTEAPPQAHPAAESGPSVVSQVVGELTATTAQLPPRTQFSPDQKQGPSGVYSISAAFPWV